MSTCRFTRDHEWVRLDGDLAIVGITDYAALPGNARRYLERLAVLTGVPLDMISTGPDRDQTIVLRHPFGG